MLLSCNEETTCLGVMDKIRHFDAGLSHPRAVIVGEPTGMQMADADKSNAIFQPEVHVHDANSSSRWLATNAVLAVANLVSALDLISDELIARGEPLGRFVPPASTEQVGRIEDGIARNILVKRCLFLWEDRGIPDQGRAKVPRCFADNSVGVARERHSAHGAYGRIDTIEDVSVPGLAPDLGYEAERLAFRCVGRDHTIAVSSATGAVRCEQAGIPTIVCGPSSIEQAHQPNEYITLDALQEGKACLHCLSVDCAA